MTIYDHDDEVICVDIRPSDSMLASMDIQGTVLVRSIANLQDAETVLYTITSIPKEVDSFAKVVFNWARPNDDKELLVLINEQVIAIALDGRHLDSYNFNCKFLALHVDNTSVLDNKFLYKMMVINITHL